ncbi:helix-turn-helix transcriptional regulator [Alicyclobacillus dauci]|uniref:Helix-turn-helix domain-containing protein n=1 Tax=Alicyclobacillus dauci TaxID=1475485 RepID=A0ABY6Z7A7_9BACL|nr:helix-turn-helix transcriptional regulator [Alicyclobacillus dauci]WAH38635.1 helix-turn-helix domain-containing protein [Alicyclobacillus dauci]
MERACGYTWTYKVIYEVGGNAYEVGENVCMENKTRLKKILEDNGIKQEWLANKAGLNSNTLSRVVTGRHLPTLRVAQKIARALNTTVDELWPLEEDE